ncbi:MAG: hypothetical protein JSV13_04825 [Nitrospiraceae bacterium]|nr:MAG: hypothetical protein JSV13_04825 [Nitrospiraceae bacterium]
MKLSGKFDLFSAVIIAVFITVFFISLYIISLLSSSTVALVDMSGELYYLTDLKSSLLRLNRALDHYVFIMGSTGPPDEIIRGLREFNGILLGADEIKIDKEEQEIVAFLQKDYSPFSLAVDSIIKGSTVSVSQK